MILKGMLIVLRLESLNHHLCECKFRINEKKKPDYLSTKFEIPHDKSENFIKV